MRFTFSAAVLAGALACVTLAPSQVDADLSKMPASADLAKRAGGAPDRIDVKTTNLTPEDGVYDVTRAFYYQSNLWKGRIAAFNPRTLEKFNVLIPGVSSTGDGKQQMAGLSLDNRKGATALYAVAKASSAFNFGLPESRASDPCSFHKFNLPVNAGSTPAWSVYFDQVQSQFQAMSGKRPFGNVASAQGPDGSSYVIFSLGIPAIAKVSADGKTVTPWFWEQGLGGQRPGYTGITYIPEANALMAFGGPRPLTLFRLNSPVPTAINVGITGFGSLAGTEKIKNIPSNNGSGSRLIGAKAPNVYAFTTTNNWASVSFRTFTRPEFQSNDLTTVVEGIYGGLRNVYGTGAYFANGPKGGRTVYPMYRLPDAILN